MAGDVVRLMRHLGHEEFAVVGHDRGSYVAARLALDSPGVVTRLAVLDSVPIGEALARADARFAAAWWHWFFFAQPNLPERLIAADPDAYYGGDPAVMGEDYRAGLGLDRAADDVDRAAGRRISCPTLVLWSTRDDMETLYGDVLAVWGPWTTDRSLTGSRRSSHPTEHRRPTQRPPRGPTRRGLHHRRGTAPPVVDNTDYA